MSLVQRRGEGARLPARKRFRRRFEWFKDRDLGSDHARGRGLVKCRHKFDGLLGFECRSHAAIEKHQQTRLFPSESLNPNLPGARNTLRDSPVPGSRLPIDSGTHLAHKTMSENESARCSEAGVID